MQSPVKYFFPSGIQVRHLAVCLLLTLALSSPAALPQNGDADVIFVRAEDHGSQGWVFHVTVSHPDTGWDDYCNGWDVLTDSGEVIKHDEADQFTRLLLHPHENEQPFTRSQSRLVIPDGASQLIVRAHDLVSGFGGQEVVIDLKEDKGQNYEITRY